ncbi:TRAP transporter large permease subunit [Anaeromyxobacter sp. Fw109-5]|uniref:TRAP transporter large permease n=1 Tax=Anaeromyxobacter sp. (strain Fw109-5) TaxID=404589 RepID=UPI0000ED7ECE|nr:TRAP transporter large permease subunit [Anaeromyxobacter sp. Fw109-5]ABS27122.1 TRAP C4-dicarboxylate transport system permease DctM subunit [Anaeromyxobacter sp. Fw109-5]
MRKELLFGFTIMGLIVLATVIIMPAPSQMTQGHLGLLMLSLVVVAIMLGFPTAFTLMGMGVLFAWLAYRWVNPDIAVQQTLDLMVQRTYATMTNDVLIAVPLFVFMGYMVERANLIEKLFKSLHLSMSFIPGSLAVATLATCALFATATGIVGAVVTLMGLLALPAMLRSGYDIKLSAGAITAGGCLGILIPPSVMLILYGATAGVSVVQLYAGAFFPGLMLAGLYIGYVVVLAKLKPRLAPMPPEEERRVPLTAGAVALAGGEHRRAVPRLVSALVRPAPGDPPRRWVAGQLAVSALPAIFGAVAFLVVYEAVTRTVVIDTGGLEEIAETGGGADAFVYEGVEEPPAEEAAPAGGAEAPAVAEPPGVEEPPGAVAEPPGAEAPGGALKAETERAEGAQVETAPGRKPVPLAFWIALAAGVALLAFHYSIFTFERLEILKMLLTSFFPLTALILAVLGSIIFGWATPTEAAALGAAGAMLLTGAYRQFKWSVLKESVFLTAKTTAMVCWLFVGSSIFSAAFALLGGQAIIEHWVLGLNLTPLQFMLLAQAIIFLLGWPLEWTEIIVIFMPIFIPLLGHFNIDPLFFGLLVALNLQTAFLSPPVAMAAFYLKGVAPKHVTLNQIFAGMMPFMAIQVFAVLILYLFPAIGLWLPQVLYR